MSSDESQSISEPRAPAYGSIPAQAPSTSTSEAPTAPHGTTVHSHLHTTHKTHIHEGEFYAPVEVVSKREAGFEDGPGHGRESEPVETPFEWEMRGKALGLILSDLVPVGLRCLLLLTILGALWSEPVWWLPCPVKKGGVATADVWLCEYTKAYVLCFPEVGLAVLLLLGARNLLHKRFYYGLLKSGGVIEYSGSNPLTDSMVLVLLWCYSHVLIFLGLILFGVIETPHMPHKGGTKKTGGDAEDTFGLDPDQLALVMSLAGFIALPGAFVVLYIYGSYDLEMDLVPLSGFIESQGDTEKAKKGVQMLASLQLLDDTQAKPFVEKYAQTLNDIHKASGLRSLYLNFLRLLPLNKSDDPPSSVKLLGSLWVAKILGKEDPVEEGSPRGLSELRDVEDGLLSQLSPRGRKETSAVFKWLWRIFLGAGVAIFTVLFGFFCVRIWGLVVRGMAGTLGFQTITVVLVELLHLVVVVMVFGQLAFCSVVRSTGAVPQQSTRDGLSTTMPGQGEGDQRRGPAVGGSRARGRGRGGGSQPQL